MRLQDLPTPATGYKWQLYTGLTLYGELIPETPPGNGLNRWPTWDGITNYTYGNSFPLPDNGTDFWVEDWEYIQAKTYTDGVWNGDIWAIVPEQLTGSGVVAVAAGGAHMSASGLAANHAVWDVEYRIGFAGSEAINVLVTKIVGSAWVHVPLSSAPPDDGNGNCSTNTINPCGGGLQPTDPTDPTDTASAVEAAQPRFRIEWVRKERAADVQYHQLGTVFTLTWPRMGINGGTYLLYAIQRRAWAEQNPPAEHNETRYTFTKLPSLTLEGEPLFFTIDDAASLIDGDLVLV